MKFGIILLIIVLLFFNVDLNDCRNLVTRTAFKQDKLKRNRLLRRKHIASKKYKKKYAAKNSDSSYKA